MSYHKGRESGLEDRGRMWGGEVGLAGPGTALLSSLNVNVKRRPVKRQDRRHRSQVLTPKLELKNKGDLIIQCKRAEFNHYELQTYGKFDSIPLTSKGWHHAKSKGDYFIIQGRKQCLGVPAILSEKNTLLAAETGCGKTLTYLLPVIQQILSLPHQVPEDKLNSPLALVVTPNRELATQIGEVASHFTNAISFTSKVITGGRTKRTMMNPSFEKIDLLIATLGTLSKLTVTGIYNMSRVRHVILDEADTLLDDSFNEKLCHFLRRFKFHHIPGVIADNANTKRVQLSLISATMPTSLPEILGEVVAMDSLVKVTTGHLHRILPHVPQKFLRLGRSQKPEQLLKLVKADLANKEPVIVFRYYKKLNLEEVHPPLTWRKSGNPFKENHPQCIRPGSNADLPIFISPVFCESSALDHATTKAVNVEFNVEVACNSNDNKATTCDWVSMFLNENGVKCVNFNGEMAYVLRQGKFKQFQDGEVNVIACTDIGSRGLNTIRVRHVINYDFPLYMADYIHRCGRTGRVGSSKDGHVTNFVAGTLEVNLVQEIEWHQLLESLVKEQCGKDTQSIVDPILIGLETLDIQPDLHLSGEMLPSQGFKGDEALEVNPKQKAWDTPQGGCSPARYCAAPHCGSHKGFMLIVELGDFRSHLPSSYSPDLAPSNYHIFRNMKVWPATQCFETNEQLKNGVNNQPGTMAALFLDNQLGTLAALFLDDQPGTLAALFLDNQPGTLAALFLDEGLQKLVPWYDNQSLAARKMDKLPNVNPNITKVINSSARPRHDIPEHHHPFQSSSIRAPCGSASVALTCAAKSHGSNQVKILPVTAGTSRSNSFVTYQVT
uniref:RNA helicase n=1 Tax=Timema bartmani TaxID=61472 RepID=A0A7R9ESR1_9NEOP|nr:unnamed protein product [Timema bartmani]